MTFDVIGSNRYIGGHCLDHRKDSTNECHRRKTILHPNRRPRQ